VKRRVVRKAFYSDEEDESSEEEVDPYYPITGGNLARALREPELLGTPTKTTSDTFFRDDVNATTLNGNGTAPIAMAVNDDEDSDLDEDHKLLLQSSMPLLKSRNSAVVLAACSLHYHCGVASIKVSVLWLCANPHSRHRR
jgi:AP-3 complex subunit beta